MTEADSDARSFFIIFKPPWSNLTLETASSKSIRGYAFLSSSLRASFFLPFLSPETCFPILRGMKAWANQVDSLSVRVTHVFNIDVVFTLPWKRLLSTQQTMNVLLQRGTIRRCSVHIIVYQYKSLPTFLSLRIKIFCHDFIFSFFLFDTITNYTFIYTFLQREKIFRTFSG